MQAAQGSALKPSDIEPQGGYTERLSDYLYDNLNAEAILRKRKIYIYFFYIFFFILLAQIAFVTRGKVTSAILYAS